MHIEICNHCYQYHRLLTYQLSSLAPYPTTTKITYTIFYSPADTHTIKTINYFRPLLKLYKLNTIPLPNNQLFNRAIGRHIVAKGTTADWVWFTDTDVLFRNNCLDILAQKLRNTKYDLVYPQTVLVSSREDGDRMIQSIISPRVIDIDETRFGESKINRAQGPYQIARSTILHETGYINNKYTQPEAKHWERTYSDVQFRELIPNTGPIKLPGSYLITHTNKGREKIITN